MLLINAIVLIVAIGAIASLAYRNALQQRTIRQLKDSLASQTEAVGKAQLQQDLLFSTNPYPMYIYDRNSLRFLSVNDAAVQAYGYTREEFLSMRLIDIRPEEEIPALLAVVNQTHPGFRRPGVWKHRRKDGSILLVEITGHQYEQDGEARELVVALDITERCRMEEALRQSKSALKSLVDNAPFGIAQAVLTTNRLSTVNPALLEILGCTYEQATQMDISTQIYADPKERDRMLEVLRRSGKIKGWETNFKSRSGSLVPVRISGLLSGGSNGQPEIFSTYVEDITQQSALEQQVRQVQKLEAVGRLAGGMAHDFNNVLVVIKLSTEMMLGQITPDSPFSKPLLQISNAADRAAALTKQMLAFSRQQIMQPRIINLNSVVADTSHMLRRVIGEDIELVTRLADTVENSKLDSDQVAQVILNLAVNARDAMPRGGMLHIETSNVTLDENYAREHPAVQPGPYVMMAVSDTGSGIDRSILPRIFDPFFTTKEVGKGTGLGLSIVYGIVKQSGGYIWVYSEPGHGTTFKLYFPATSAPIDRAASRFDNGSSPTGQLVLVVEDEASIRSNVRDCLQQLGYRVVVAEDGARALKVCEELDGRIDLILTDLVMPGKTGQELSVDIADRWPVIPVLFMSGYTEDSAIRRSALMQGCSFLQKPFSVADLANAVRGVLAMKTASL